MSMTTDAIPNLKTAIAATSPDEAADKLRGLWEHCDKVPMYPVGTDAVVELLTECGYRVCRGDLIGMIDRKAIEKPRHDGNRLCWGPRDILAALVILDSGRRWDPLHVRHIHRSTGAEVQSEQARRAGEKLFADVDTLTIEQILCVLAKAEDPGVRDIFRVALIEKLRGMGVLGV